VTRLGMPGGFTRLVRVPELGMRVPAVTPRAVFALVCVALCVIELRFGFVFVIALLLAAVTVVLPRLLTAWAFLLLLAGNQAIQDPSAHDWKFFVLLAGLHLVHVLASQLLVLPARGWIQLRVFAKPLRRFLIIQIAAQFTAALVLLLLLPRTASLHLSVPVLGIVGAGALVALAIVLIAPLVREKSR
jgi:hypothetical protein